MISTEKSINQSSSTSVLEAIAKPETAFYAVLGLVLFVSTPHLASTFKELNDFHQVPAEYRTLLGWTVGVLFSLFLELGIMYFALKNQIWTTMVFMLISFALSLHNYKENLSEFSFDSLNSVLISLSIPLLICMVSHGARLKMKEDGIPEPEKLSKPEKQVSSTSQLRVEPDKSDVAAMATAGMKGSEAGEKIKGIVTDLKAGKTYDEITTTWKVGRGTISKIKRKLEEQQKAA